MCCEILVYFSVCACVFLASNFPKKIPATNIKRIFFLNNFKAFLSLNLVFLDSQYLLTRRRRELRRVCPSRFC